MPALPAAAACTGRDLIADMPPADRAAFDARLAAVPFAEGLIWRATRGDAVIHLIGTYHFDDPRHEALMARAAPLLEGAAALLVEAGPAEEAAVMRALADRPDLLFETAGPTLPEALPGADWQALMTAMRARGVPAVIASRFRPWFVAAQLALPPCMAREAAKGRHGLDRRLMQAAVAADIPVRPLEPWDTIFRLFEDVPASDAVALIRTALIMEGSAEDMSATLAAAYFAERPWAIWLFSQDRARATPGIDAADLDRQVALTEDLLMARRNRAWIPVLLAEAAAGPVVAAFGALHLPGEAGVLALLEAEGFTLTRLR